MKRLQHPASSYATHSSLDLFSVLPTSVGEKSGREREIPTVHPLTSEGPFEFQLQSQYAVDLSRSYVYCKFRIFTEQGLPHPATKRVQQKDGTFADIEAERVAPAQGLAKAIFSHATVTVNGVTVEDVPLFHFKSFLEYEYTANQKQKEQLERNLMYSTLDDGLEDDTNDGYIERAGWLKGGQVGEMQFRPALALFQQEKVWPRSTDLRIRFDRNPDSMLLECYDAAQGGMKFKLHIDDMRLLVREVDLEEQANESIERALQAGNNILYNLRPVEMRSFHLAAGRQEFESVLTNTPRIPLRCLICFVPNKNFQGDLQTSLFRFVPGGVGNISLMIGGAPVGYASSVPIDWANNLYMRVYQAHIDALGMKNDWSGVTFEQFGKFRALYCWEISPNSEDDCMSLAEPGILSVKINFAAPLPEPLMMVAYLESTSVIQVTSTRNVIISTPLHA